MAVETRPQLHRDALEYWEAFQVLHVSRANTGFGPGPILLSEIVAYTELMEIPMGEEQRQYMRLIRAMDRAYLDWSQTQHV